MTRGARPTGSGRRRRWILAALGAALVGLAVVLPWAYASNLADALASLRGSISSLGPWGPAAFALLVALATLLLLPGSPFGVAAGAAFGLWVGAAAMFTGAVLGATGALLLARGVARPHVERWLEGHARLRALDDLLAVRGPWVAGLLRLTPALPFNLLNYALGLTRLSLVGSLVACLAMIPGTLLYVGLGAAAGEAARGGPGAGLRIALLVAGLGAGVGVSVWLARAARRALPSNPLRVRKGSESPTAPG